MSQAEAKAWSVLDLLQWTAPHLAKKGVANARREAEDLLGHVLELDRLKLYLQFEYQPSPAELAAYRELVRRRGEREPLQHLLGQMAFDGLRLRADRRALIPRPETEALAALAAGLPLPEGAVADIGTGSGCLALALARRLDRAVIATDSSAEALALARENAALNALEAKVEFLQGSLWEPLQGREPMALIVSNPPYIPEGDRGALQPEVGLWEPASALYAGPEGLDLLRPLLRGGSARLASGGWLALECGQGQPAVLAGEAGGWAETRIEKDPYGVERFFLARKG